MNFKSILSAIATALVLCGTANAADPLFESNELLNLKLQGPFKLMNKERDTEKQYSPATLTYKTGEATTQLPVELQVRGKRRLSKSTCKFAPVRLLLKKEDTKQTLFKKQKKLKLVTQCFPLSNQYEHYVIVEHLMYRAFNLLTDNSYRTRLASIEYSDEDGKPFQTSYGFLIEPSKRLAKRIDRKRYKPKETNAKRLNGQHTNLVSLFQFMAGNTDWSATHGGTEECCHNGKLFGEPEGNDNLIIPYDFDMTGLVNPEYASVAPALKLKNIRQRRYRGYCRNNEFLESNIALFNEKKPEILSLFADTPYLNERVKKNKIAYIEKFYGIINNPKRVKRYIHGWCHASTMVEAAE